MTLFRETLKDVVENVDGGLGAVVMGYDGIAIEEYVKDQQLCDVQLLAVEYVTLLKEVRNTVDILKTGAMDEMTVTTEKISAMARTISEEFFVLLVLTADGNCGKGRFLLRRAVPQLREELQ